MPARFLASHEDTAFVATSPKILLLAALHRGRCAARRHVQLPPPRAELRLSAIIPAKNEAAALPATPVSLAVQTDLCDRPLPAGSYEVLVLANNCTDATAAVVRQQARRFPHLVLHTAHVLLPVAQAYVGRVRRLLMNAACARLDKWATTPALLLVPTPISGWLSCGWRPPRRKLPPAPMPWETYPHRNQRAGAAALAPHSAARRGLSSALCLPRRLARSDPRRPVAAPPPALRRQLGSPRGLAAAWAVCPKSGS